MEQLVLRLGRSWHARIIGSALYIAHSLSLIGLLLQVVALPSFGAETVQGPASYTANAKATPPVVPQLAAPATELVDPSLNGVAKVAGAILWPIAIISVIALLAPICKTYLMLVTRTQALRREERRSLSRVDWAYSEYVGVTETVATIVAAAVAARLIKAGGRVEETIPYEKLRSIVRRMTQSINIGETRALQGAHIAWVHRCDAEDYYEQHAFENLGAHVHFFRDNESLLEYIAECARDVVVVISNRQHWVKAQDENERRPLDGESAAMLLPDLKKLLHQKEVDVPILIYSRSVSPDYGETLQKLGAELWTDIPEVIIHRVFSAAETHKGSRRSVS